MDSVADVQRAPDAFIGIRQVSEMLGFSKSTILRKVKARELPAAVIEEGNTKRWSRNECQEYQQARIRERDERQHAQAERARKAA